MCSVVQWSHGVSFSLPRRVWPLAHAIPRRPLFPHSFQSGRSGVLAAFSISHTLALCEHPSCAPLASPTSGGVAVAGVAAVGVAAAGPDRLLLTGASLKVWEAPARDVWARIEGKSQWLQGLGLQVVLLGWVSAFLIPRLSGARSHVQVADRLRRAQLDAHLRSSRRRRRTKASFREARPPRNVEKSRLIFRRFFRVFKATLRHGFSGERFPPHPIRFL